VHTKCHVEVGLGLVQEVELSKTDLDIVLVIFGTIWQTVGPVEVNSGANMLTFSLLRESMAKIS